MHPYNAAKWDVRRALTLSGDLRTFPQHATTTQIAHLWLFFTALLRPWFDVTQRKVMVATAVGQVMLSVTFQLNVRQHLLLTANTQLSMFLNAALFWLCMVGTGRCN